MLVDSEGKALRRETPAADAIASRPVDAERWRRLNEAFDAALTLAPSEQAAFVARAAAEDAELGRELEELLAAHVATGLDEAAVARLAATLDDGATPPEVGRRFGPYRASAVLGRGGMGTVLLAAREDGQFEQQVAIKLIRRGMSTDQILERFRVERQILASLEHPHIARLLDGGTTEDGLSFLVMEAIEGRAIDLWCDENGLSVRERLGLFLQVCDAVSYAHQRLIVHRDIKPQNILVTRDGTPKLLDFGIAKVLSADGGSESMTIGPAPMLTPDYASPEQIEGRPTTTSTDVYSLGVVLYELLTGRSPYRPPSWSVPELCAAVQTTEVERPSTAVGRRTTDERARVRSARCADWATATNAGTLGRLRTQLAGDLDAIVLSALAKEPERRYASVEQLADDLRRHLDGRPVRARPAGFGYRAMKFVDRNRVAVAAAALVALTLLASTLVAARQAREARRQAGLAVAAQRTAERRFAEVRRLANTVLFDYHDAIQNLPGATPVRERLVSDALGYLERLAAESAGDAALGLELARAYRKVAEVQGGSTKTSLGNTAGAIESSRKGLALLEALVAREPRDPEALRELAELSNDVAKLELEAGDARQALVHAERARAVADSLFAGTPRQRAVPATLVSAYDTLGTVHLESGQVGEALAAHRRQLEMLSAATEADRKEPAFRRSLSTAHHHLADAQAASGDFAGALESYRTSLALREELSNEQPLNTDYLRLRAVSHFYVADMLSNLGRPREALAEFRRSLALEEELAAAEPESDTSGPAYALVQIGAMLTRLGDHQGAVVELRRARAIREASVRADPSSLWKLASLVDSRARLCGVLATLGAPDAASDCLGTARLMDEVAVDPSNSWYRTHSADCYAALGDAFARLAEGEAAEASGAAMRRRAIEMYRKSRDLFADLSARGILGASDAAKPDAVARALARTEGALGD